MFGKLTRVATAPSILGAEVTGKKGSIGRTEHRSCLSGMASIIRSWFKFGVAPEEVVYLFPAVVIRVNHLPSHPCYGLYRKRG